jgi:hypothetical protein
MFIPTKHRIGAILFLPNEDDMGAFHPPSKGHHLKVMGHDEDADGRPTCTLIQLMPLRRKPAYTSNNITEAFHKVADCSALQWKNPATKPEQRVDGDILSVEYTTQRVSTLYSPRGARGKQHVQSNNYTIFPIVYLITPQHYVKTDTTNITGPTHDNLIAAHQDRLIRSIERNEDGHEVVTTDTQTHSPCAQCGYLDTDTNCANTPSCEA